MKATIIHLSDLHYRTGWPEAVDVVLDSLLDDLRESVAVVSPYLAFSGDFVHAGENSDAYSALAARMNAKLTAAGLPTERRIVVPGNHDVSSKVIGDQLVEHEGVVSQALGETEFNNYVSSGADLLSSKFENYLEFEQGFARFGVGQRGTGAGWVLDGEIGVYCLNSALCSTGGVRKNASGAPCSDRARLAVDTRSLQTWLTETTASTKVLLMHHPFSWLTDWCQNELKALVGDKFRLVLSGHEHEQITVSDRISRSGFVHCSAPPLFTSKEGDLGYAIVDLCSDIGVERVRYRQWSPKHRRFVPGTLYSGTDDGCVVIPRRVHGQSGASQSRPDSSDPTLAYFEARWRSALVSFSSQPVIWVEPQIGRSNETKRSVDEPDEKVVAAISLAESPRSVVIKAPPQFGLTCLAHHLVAEARRIEPSKCWLYLDAKQIKATSASIKQAMKRELDGAGCELGDVSCIVLDSWSFEGSSSQKLLDKVSEVFRDLPLVVMSTLDPAHLLETKVASGDRGFEELFLWSLPRSMVRAVVRNYNEERHVGDEDVVTARVVSDLEVLNIHRTPLHCMTLLKVAEVDFDESPVNRTEMIRRVLFLLFNVDEVPRYKERPDLKDCEHVLGYFAEKMIKSNRRAFSRDDFLESLRTFCRERVLDLDVEVVFDVLHQNNIITRYGTQFSFRFSYWLFYFAAQRMHQDREFADFILSDLTYAKYPEVIEFYTGIDRRREDALRVLTVDLERASQIVQDRIGIPDGINPYRHAVWTPSAEAAEQMREEIEEGVRESQLSDAVKDGYADRHYDPSRPYTQEILEIFEEDSFLIMIQAMRAGSRALRNSDYADPDTKRALLAAIVGCWEQISKVMFVVSPILAKQGHATFEGTTFVMVDGFEEDASLEDRLSAVLSCIPNTVVVNGGDDLYSRKMGPLLIEHLEREENAVMRHELVLLLIKQRPRRWKEQVQTYIAECSRNSFYLCDVLSTVRAEYRYGYLSGEELEGLRYLAKMAIAKHSTGAKSPGPKMIKKVGDGVLPLRHDDS